MTNTTDYSDLKALFVNCTLKRGPEISNTQGLMDLAMGVMREQRVEVDGIRAIDHRHRHRRLARHDRAWLGARRLAGDPRAASWPRTSS